MKRIGTSHSPPRRIVPHLHKSGIGPFAAQFAVGGIDGLLEHYKVDAVFPIHHMTAQGIDQIRAVLQGLIASGAKLEFERRFAFETIDIALIQNA